MEKINLNFFALAALGKGLSGSDRIFIEFARRWSKKLPVNIYLWSEGYEMCERQDLKSKNISYKISNMKPWSSLGFIVNYFARIYEGIRLGLVLEVKNDESTIIYSASDFWMDVFPCFILKVRFSNIKWVATWYQTAPNPFVGYSEGNRAEKYRLSAFLYWFSQFPIKPLISNFASFILVNNDEEKKQFSKLDSIGKVVVVLGAIDLLRIERWKTKNGKLPKTYDAIFQGRLHPQKGAVELIEIWKKVVNKKKNAKLAMIGDGPLMDKVKIKIKSLKLENNITLFGYLFDGDEKYKIFAQSKIVVHPAFFDSGGMAAAEAMAFGMPCVGFNLKSYISYYPKGMVKIKIGDLDAFSTAIIKLLDDNKYREEMGTIASDMIKSSWSWDTRAKKILNNVKS